MYFAQAQDNRGQDILGSDGGTFINLKTNWGAVNRIRRFSWNKRACKVVLSYVPYSDRYRLSAYKRICTVDV